MTNQISKDGAVISPSVHTMIHGMQKYNRQLDALKPPQTRWENYKKESVGTYKKSLRLIPIEIKYYRVLCNSSTMEVVRGGWWVE